MNYPLIMFDVDGTLVDEEGQISAELVEYLYTLKSRGIILVINSGRPALLAYRYFQKLAPDLFKLFIGCNGAELYDGENDRFRQIKAFSLAEIHELKKILSHPKLISAVYEQDVLLVDRPCLDEELHNFLVKRGIRYRYGTPCGSYSKMLGLHRSEDHRELADFVKKISGDFFDLTFSSKRVLEVLVKNVDKSLGVREVCKLYSLDPKAILSFGDGDNDIEMLSLSTGVVMKEASVVLKELIGRCADEGLYQYLLKIYG